MALKDSDRIQEYLPYDDDMPLPKEEDVRQESLDHLAEMLANVAIGLFLIFIVVVTFQILPIRLLDPAWILTFADSVCKAVLIPLVGLLLFHGAAALASPYLRIHARRFQISRLALVPVIGYLLLVPLIGFANWRGIKVIQTKQQIQNVRINKNNQILIRDS